MQVPLSGTLRRVSRVINIGDLKLGGDNPIRVQSMTTTNTQDVEATVKQSLALAEAGCEIIRITAPNKKAATALGEISRRLRIAKCKMPLVADIHFLPSAAMEAVKYVERFASTRVIMLTRKNLLFSSIAITSTTEN